MSAYPPTRLQRLLQPAHQQAVQRNLPREIQRPFLFSLTDDVNELPKHEIILTPIRPSATKKPASLPALRATTPTYSLGLAPLPAFWLLGDRLSFCCR